MDTKTLISLIFILQAVINGVSLAVAQKPGLRINHQSIICSKKGNFTSDVVIERDVALAILLLHIETPLGTYTGTETGYGHGVWSVSLCPPNIKREVCHECVNKTNTYLKDKCPKQKEGVAWTVLEQVICIVRYADYHFHDKLSEWAYATFASPPNASPSNPTELEKELNNLANKLKEIVANVNIVTRYGSGSVTFGPGSRTTLYGSMQCTYGIAQKDCIKCLSDVTTRVHRCCSKQRSLSGIAASTNCYFWYQHNNFLPKTYPAIVSSASMQT